MTMTDDGALPGGQSTELAPVAELTHDAARLRLALNLVDREAHGLRTSLKRAVPFLVRTDVAVEAAPSRAIVDRALLAEVTRPAHMTALRVGRGADRGVFAIDSSACAALLEGVLGGDPKMPAPLQPEGFSSPQRALLDRLSETLLTAFATALGARSGLLISRLNREDPEIVSGRMMIVIAFDLGLAGNLGRILLALPKDVLLDHEGASISVPNDAPDSRIANVVQAAELSLVAELGRVRLRLERLAELRVGDVVPLDLPVSGSVTVRADTQVILEGHPTTHQGRLAIRITTRHEF
jgi:flagellar motor switch protein FliM